jgi:large repetitive protein
MFSSRLSLAAATVACLITASGAAADPLDTFTGTASPSLVQPSATGSYTISLTTDPLAPNRAQRATIGIPSGFTVDPVSVQGTTTAVAGACDAATWEADGAIIANQTIQLRRSGGNASSLCPGATLNVVFTAVSPATEETYPWPSGLVNDLTGPFTLVGAAPSIVVDGTGPTMTITGKPNNPTNATAASFTFTASEGGSSFSCRLENDAFTPCTSPTSYSGLTDGQHSFSVTATDLAGNTGAAATYTWTIDTVAATVAIVQKPSNLAATSSATFAFTASESGSSFSCRVDESGFVPCASPVTYNLADGPHVFSVRATDPAGNTGPDVPYGWTIETRAPTASLMLAPPGLSNSRSATFGFAADEPSTFECKADEGGFAPCISPMSYGGLGDGAHVFSVRARDGVGNLSVPVSHAWTIDATAPETMLTAMPGSGTATSATFAFAASESGTFECRVDGAPFTPCGSPKSYAGLSQADHQFEVRAIDAAGNVDATPSLHAWKVRAPTARKAASALMSPRAGSRVKRPPLLVWRRVAGARYYNVQLFRGRKKVFTGWPTRTRLQLRARWTNRGRTERLVPGRYRWFVWPGYTNPRRYGALLGQSTFVVARR